MCQTCQGHGPFVQETRATFQQQSRQHPQKLRWGLLETWCATTRAKQYSVAAVIKVCLLADVGVDLSSCILVFRTGLKSEISEVLSVEKKECNFTLASKIWLLATHCGLQVQVNQKSRPSPGSLECQVCASAARSKRMRWL